MIEHNHVELLFGISEYLLPVLAVLPEVARRNVPLLVPFSSATSIAGSVLFIRPDYDHEIVAAHNRLRQFGIRRIAFIAAAGFGPQLEARLCGPITKGNAAEPLDLYILTGDPVELAARIAPTRPTAVIIADDTLTYATIGRTLAWQGWYGFLAGLSSANPQVVREILGFGYSGGMLLAQTVLDPANGITKAAREHMAWVERLLDESSPATTLSGHITAVYLVQAMNAVGGKMTDVELRRALQTCVDVGEFTLDLTCGSRGSESVDLNYIRGAGN